MAPTFNDKATRLLEDAKSRRTAAELDPMSYFAETITVELPEFSEIPVLSEEIARREISSKNSGALDPNNFTPHHMKVLAKVLAPKIAEFSEIIYRHGMPDSISFPFHPIYKSEVSTPIEPNDFRPIGSVCLVLKPIIRNAFNALENHTKPARDIDQHGFTNKSGVITLIMTLLTSIFLNANCTFYYTFTTFRVHLIP